PSGLRQRLIDAADVSSGGLSTWVVALAPALASERQLDIVAKTVLNNSPPVYTNNDFMLKNSSGDGFWAALFDRLKGGTAAGGILGFSGLFAVTMAAVIPALPMVQAVILLGIYGLLPMLVVLSRYSLTLLVLGAMLIFTVKFWTVLWYFALWVDQNLIASMYPDISLFLEQFSLDNLATGEQSTKRLLLNMITTSLYLGLPLLWTGIMALAGLQVGRAVSQATDTLRAPAQGAGQTGGNMARSTIDRGTGGRLRL
ncbi:MAG: conjugal transfer protein TraG, partial [bacterium]|nr:conjugal transfer protein TraG [bacterium]